MDKITINDVLDALKVIGEKMELIDSRNISGVTQELLNIAGSDLRIVEETDLEEKTELYYYGKSKDIESAIFESENSPRLEIEDGYVKLNIPDWDMPMLQFSISNPNDEYNLVEAFLGNYATQPQRIDSSVDIKAVLAEIIEKSEDEYTIERAENALSFLDNFMELTLEKDVNREDKNAPYYKVAKKALMNWNGLSEEEALKIIQEQNFEEIEGKVWATGSMNYAIAELAKKIELSKEEQEEFSKMIFGENENSENIVRILAEKTEGKDKDELVLNMLSSVHDGWVKDNSKKFFARDKKYQHLPLELIGWKEVEADLLFVGSIAESIGIDIDEKKLEEAYNERVEQFKADKGIESNNDLRRLISEGADFYPALKGQDDILFALSNQAFVSSFVLKEKMEDVLKENEFVFDLSNKFITGDMIDFADDFDILGMITDGHNNQWESLSEENRYHLSTEDKQMLLENAKLIGSKYNKTANMLRSEVYEERRVGREDWETVEKSDQPYTEKGISYKNIVDTADWIMDRQYAYYKFREAEEIIENEVADAKITNSLQSIHTKGRDERKGVIKGLMAEYDFKRFSEDLSDDDLEIVAEIKEEEITANDSVINQKKDRINVLTRREQLMKKLAEQEKTLKSQESEIKSLDYDIKRLESRQEQK